MKIDIDDTLWNIIENHYEKEFYTDAVKDACIYLNEIIQNKTGLNEIDGEKLINMAFSEKDPKILINPNQTTTEKDIQRGTGYLLRGIVTSIRNPINHKAINYNKKEADSILLFISNYVLPKIDNSKESTYIDSWFDFIFIENSNYSNEYFDIVISKISKKEKLSLMVEIINRISEIKKEKYKYFVNKLYDSLNKSEQLEVNNVINRFLLTTKDENGSLTSFFNHFNCTIWKSLDELSKTRIEEMICESIEKGNSNDKSAGYLATWANAWCSVFSNKDKIIAKLFRKLSVEKEAKYVIDYFCNILIDKNVIKDYSKKIESELKNGNKYYKELIDYTYFKITGTKLPAGIVKEYKQFKENENYFDDNLPFY